MLAPFPLRVQARALHAASLESSVYPGACGGGGDLPREAVPGVPGGHGAAREDPGECGLILERPRSPLAHRTLSSGENCWVWEPEACGTSCQLPSPTLWLWVPGHVAYCVCAWAEGSRSKPTPCFAVPEGLSF